MKSRLLLGLGILLASATASLAQVKLEYKLREGDAYHVESTTKTTQKLTINGTDVDTEGETRTVAKNTVGKREADGTIRVQEKVESFMVSSTIMGQMYLFDSANPDNKGNSPLEALRDVHKQLAQRTTTSVYDKYNQIVKVEMDQDLLGALPAEIRAAVKGQLDPEALKTAAKDELDVIKSDTLNKGDTWKRTRTISFGSGQAMSIENEYTYDGPVEQQGQSLDKVTFKTLSVTFSIENSNLPLAVKDADLKPGDSGGTILFDRQTGRIVDSSATMKIMGQMTLVINGMDLPTKLDLKVQTATVVKP